jgi:hypothetical protein
MIEDSLIPIEEELSFEVSPSGERISKLMKELSEFGFKVTNVTVINDFLLFDVERNTYLLRKVEDQLNDLNFFVEGEGICFPLS